MNTIFTIIAIIIAIYYVDIALSSLVHKRVYRANLKSLIPFRDWWVLLKSLKSK